MTCQLEFVLCVAVLCLYFFLDLTSILSVLVLIVMLPLKLVSTTTSSFSESVSVGTVLSMDSLEGCLKFLKFKLSTYIYRDHLQMQAFINKSIKLHGI